MKCFVDECKNNSKTLNKSRRITFHPFPSNTESCRLWLKALGKEGAHCKRRAVVCSAHFVPSDFINDSNGIQHIRDGAIPKVFQLCRICLIVDGKFYDLEKYNLLKAYEELTGLSTSSAPGYPSGVCVECARRLLNCVCFREKTLRAHTLLSRLLDACGQLTPFDINTEVREKNNLVSSLRVKKFEAQHYDYNFEETENILSSQQDTENHPSLHEVNVDIEVKCEEIDKIVDVFHEDNSAGESVKDEVICDAISDNPFPDNNSVSSDDLPIIKKIKPVKTILRKKRLVKKRKLINKAQPKIDRRRKLLGDDLDDKIFASTYLDNEQQISEFQKREESANYKNAVYKCASCFKGFLDEEAYNNHMMRHTDQCGSYECDICKIRFKQSHALRNHVTSHTQKFTCKCCPYVTFRKQTAKLHEQWHNGTRYQCPHCQEEFLKFTTYMGHIRIKHPSDCVCHLCGYSFVSEKGLRLHKKLKHRMDELCLIPDNGPLCQLCDIKFSTEDALKRHLQVSARHNQSDSTVPKDRQVHKKQRKTRERNDSGIKERTVREDLKKRRQNVKPEGPIPCEQCNMQLEDSRTYYKHFRRMHPDKNRTNYPSMKSPCMCEVCGRMFQTLALLQDHSWVHTGEKRFKCDECHKSFQQKQRLVAHRHIHSQQRATYVCNVCGKHFTTHSNRQRHMFSHTGLKPFKCEMCGKSFKHASEKRAHVTYVHLKKPWPKRSRGKRKDVSDAPTLTHREVTSRDMEIIEPLWPYCADPKVTQVMQNKPMYYNLKI